MHEIRQHQRLRLNIQPIALTIGLNLVLSFSLPNISWQAHIGGLIAGVGLGAAWGYAPRANRTAIQIGSSVALAAILVTRPWYSFGSSCR